VILFLLSFRNQTLSGAQNFKNFGGRTLRMYLIR
jgi:hypothetical protein